MTDVFISYCRTDEEIANQLTAALQEAGISCWMDQQIPGGSTFADIVERELENADKVVVLWSKDSVHSSWVKDEAEVGRDQDKLIPLSIDGTLPPLGFRQIQAIDFTNWPLKQEPFVRLKTVLDSPGNAGLTDTAPAMTPHLQKPAKRKSHLLAAIAGAALVLSGSAYVVTNGFPGMSEAVANEPISIAIMPFSVQGDVKQGDDQLGNGLAGALNDSLSHLSGIALTSNSATAQLSAGGMAMPDIGKQLDVGYFVEGELNLDDEETVLAVSLVDAATTRQIWREQYRGPRTSMPALAEQATDELARVMQTRLGVGTGVIASSSKVDPEAYEAYLRGLQYLLGDHVMENRRQAYNEFSRSIRLDPDFAPAHAGLGRALQKGIPAITEDLNQEEYDALKFRSIERALELDPGNLMARLTKQGFVFFDDAKPAAAIEALRQFVKEHPDYYYGQNQLAHYLAVMGEHDAALQHYREALRTDPLNRTNYQSYLLSLVSLGKYDDIRREALNCIDCTIASQAWISGVLWLTSDEQFPREMERLVDRYANLGVPDEELQAQRAIGIAMRSGLPSPTPLSQFPPSLLNMLILAEFSAFELALQMLDEVVPGSLWTGQLILLLDTPRSEWPAAVRADPRYHAKFDAGYIGGVIKERRKRGHTQNLPVFPVRRYKGT